MTIVRQSAAANALASPRSATRIGDFVALTKPRVMTLVMFTAFVGFAVAPGRRDALTGCIALLCIAAGAGGAGALNMWYEAELDAEMPRTAGRPIPNNRVSAAEALAFGLALATAGVAGLVMVNVGRQAPEIVFTHLMEGIGLALDRKAGRMFVTDFGGSLYSANFDGTDKKLLLYAEGNLTGIAYAELP